MEMYCAWYLARGFDEIHMIHSSNSPLFMYPGYLRVVVLAAITVLTRLFS